MQAVNSLDNIQFLWFYPNDAIKLFDGAVIGLIFKFSTAEYAFNDLALKAVVVDIPPGLT